MSEFLKGEYIVSLSREEIFGQFTYGTIYKQKVDSRGIQPEYDDHDSAHNGWTHISKDKDNWRYATNREILYYELNGNRPINIKDIPDYNIEEVIGFLDRLEQKKLKEDKIF